MSSGDESALGPSLLRLPQPPLTSALSRAPSQGPPHAERPHVVADTASSVLEGDRKEAQQFSLMASLQHALITHRGATSTSEPGYRALAVRVTEASTSLCPVSLASGSATILPSLSSPGWWQAWGIRYTPIGDGAATF